MKVLQKLVRSLSYPNFGLKRRCAMKSNIPFIGRIPLLGHLFSSSNQMSSQSELVIIITPKLIP